MYPAKPKEEISNVLYVLQTVYCAFLASSINLLHALWRQYTTVAAIIIVDSGPRSLCTCLLVGHHSSTICHKGCTTAATTITSYTFPSKTTGNNHYLPSLKILTLPAYFFSRCKPNPFVDCSKLHSVSESPKRTKLGSCLLSDMMRVGV
jgi:hypothetical protein